VHLSTAGLRRLAGLMAGALATVGVVVATSPQPVMASGTETYNRPADGALHLAGHGFGHGRGMSQWGAYGGAESGQTYQQILDWYYANPTFGTANGSIRVQITGDGLGSDKRYDAQVLPAAGLTASDNAGHSLVVPTQTSSGTAYDKWRGVLAPNGVLVLEGHTSSGWTTIAPPAGGSSTAWTGWIRFTDKARIVSLVRSNGTTVMYRDWVELDQVNGAQGVTVNLVSLEHYLYGVVPSEMPCSWTPTVSGAKRLDALESQAIAARTYATWRRAHPRSALVDIVDNTSDQAYGGYSAEKTAASQCAWSAGSLSTSASDAAVDATRSQVLVDSNGAALFSQYSASNGGFEVAGSQSYLPTRPDAWDGVPTESWNSHDWSDTVTAGQLQSSYSSIGTFTSLTVNSRESLSGTDQNGRTTSEQWGGRITSLTVNGSTGSTTVTGAQFAATMGLQSDWFTVVVTAPAAPGSVTATAGDGQATVKWTTPSSDGGSGISGYRITASPSITPVTTSAGSRSAVITGLTNGTSYTFSVAAINASGTGAAKAASPVTPQAQALFHPLARARILNTTTSGGTPVAAKATRSVQVAGVGGAPSSGVIAAVLTVISTRSTAGGGLAIAPHGGPRPANPQVTWRAGVQVANTVWTKLSAGGAVDLANLSAGSTDVIVVLDGYYTDSLMAGDAMTAAAPTRLFSGAVAAGHPQPVPLTGVPTGADAVVVNVTVINPSSRAAVTVSSGCAETSTPVVYAPARTNRANTAVLKLCNGGLSVVSTSAATLLVDLQGWFAPGSAALTLFAPAKQVLHVSVPARSARTLALSSANGVPSTGVASVLLTLTDRTPGTGYLVAYPTGVPRPRTSDVDQDRSGAAVNTVMVAGGGRVTIYNNSSTSADTLVDLVGWSG
jgi:SpoIID/LytB domain protein